MMAFGMAFSVELHGRRMPSYSSTTRLYQQSSPSTQSTLDFEEPLSNIFQRGVVLQRAGSYAEALQQYDLFLKAAVQCDIDPKQYAEVHVNMGASYLRLQDSQKAEHHFSQALTHRSMGTAHVNLAVLALQSLAQVQDQVQGLEILDRAKRHCLDALQLENDDDDDDDDDPQATKTALRLLGDIERMLSQMQSSV
jgi:tetratricopeptide (TPR) repeat protein